MRTKIFLLLTVTIFSTIAAYSAESCGITDVTPMGCSTKVDAANQNNILQQISQLNNESKNPKAVLDVKALPVTIDMFYAYDCPHCHDAISWLPELKKKYPNVQVNMYEIKLNPANLSLFIKTSQKYNLKTQGVPTFFIGDKSFVGYNKDQTCCVLLEEIDRQSFQKQQDVPPKVIKVPMIGSINPEQVSLLGFSITIGLLDGLNPCAIWVLVFLLGLLAHTKSQKKVLMIGGIFVLTSGLVYFAFMSAWFNFFLVIGYSEIIRYILGAIAIGMGLLNIKEIFFFKKGISLMIPDEAKPRIATKIKSIMQEKSMFMAGLSTFLLAIFVNFIELGCTAGLPAIFTKILAEKNISIALKYLYMGIYNIAYILPLIIIVGIFVVTLGHFKMSERQGKILKFASGALMFLLGIIMLIKPETLSVT